jgi:SAM-dependent methyltransferase
VDRSQGRPRIGLVVLPSKKEGGIAAVAGFGCVTIERAQAFNLPIVSRATSSRNPQPNMNDPLHVANPSVFPVESRHGHLAPVDDGYSLWKGWRAADFGRVNYEESLYFERELQATGIGKPAGLRVGEIGYGNGAFAGWARRAGAHWIGRETSQAMQARAREAGFDILPPDSSLSDAWGDSALDLIVAFDVVEHMSLCAIRSLLKEAKAALKPSGLLLLRIPSGDSPFVSAIYWGDVTHCTLLGSSAVRQLARELDLEVRQIRSPVLPMSGLSKARLVRRAAVRFARWVAFSFIRTALMGNGSAILTPNMIVVLARLPGTGGCRLSATNPALGDAE